MVFYVSCDNKNASSENQNPLLPGILDCHVTTGDDTPLLLSLFAQSTLGLLKDLKNFVCYIQRNNGEMWKLPLCRTKGSNLLAVNLTGGFRGLMRIPRPLRPYRTPLPRPNQSDINHRDQVETERLSIKNEPTCEEDLREANTADAHTCSSSESAGVMAKKDLDFLDRCELGCTDEALRVGAD